MKVITFARYAYGLARARVDLSETHLCKRAHATHSLSRRAFLRWDENKDKDKTVRCRCGRPAHPIHARGAR